MMHDESDLDLIFITSEIEAFRYQTLETVSTTNRPLTDKASQLSKIDTLVLAVRRASLAA